MLRLRKSGLMNLTLITPLHKKHDLTSSYTYASWYGAVHKLCRLKTGDFWPPSPSSTPLSIKFVVFLLGKMVCFLPFHLPRRSLWMDPLQNWRVFQLSAPKKLFLSTHTTWWSCQISGVKNWGQFSIKIQRKK